MIESDIFDDEFSLYDRSKSREVGQTPINSRKRESRDGKKSPFMTKAIDKQNKFFSRAS